MGTLAHLVPAPRLGRRRQVAARPGFAAPCRASCPVVREKAGFTHDGGNFWTLVCVENVLVRTARKMIWRDNDNFPHKKAGRALRPTCFHQVTVGKLAVQPFTAIGINLILQDTEVQDLFVSDLAFVLPFPLSQERIESPRNVCSKYRPSLENE